MTPKQHGGPLESPESTVKLDGPRKWVLLQQLNAQQQLLASLLAAKQQRAKSASPGPLYADGER